MKRVGLAVVLLVWLVAPAWADFQEGLAAYKRGEGEKHAYAVERQARLRAGRPRVAGSSL